MLKKPVRNESLKTSKVGRPLHATNFNSLMYPNFILNLILGSFPYKLGSATYVFSKPRFVYSTILIVCYVASLLNILYRINFNNFTDDNVASLIHTNLFFFLDGCIILVMYAVSRDRLRLLQTVLETSHILSSHDFNNLAKLIHAKDILGSVFLLAHLPRLFAPDLAIALRHLVALYIIIVNFSMDMFYMNCVCVLKTCFKKINESLLQMIKTLSKDESRSEIWMKKMSHQELRNPLLLIRLKHLEDKHLQISDCVQLLNNTYLTRVVVMAMSSFAVITFNLYFYMLWRGGALLDQQYQLWFVPYIISAIYHFLKFALIIWACETATNQSLKIHTTIHDFLSIATDASVKRELTMFSLQVQHCDNKFSAKAFTMNASLLTNMLGGIAMYILILFQFLLNSIACQFSN